MEHQPENLVVAGGSGGIGRAMVAELLRRFPEASVHATRYRGNVPLSDERLYWHEVDLRDAGAIENLANKFERVDWLVNCAGFLHGAAGGPEKSIAAVEPEFVLENIRINTLPTLLLAKHFMQALRQSPAPLLATVSAKVGSIEDNRLGGWYSYRLSKAALNMALKTLSIEWKHRLPRGCVAALHPGTNDTALSQPFQSRVKPDDLFEPGYTAEKFVDLLSRLDSSESGKFWAWDGERLPW